ncbi:hypothetical protein M427DRAFT_33352 [Gonapodya prolifera JEL478]|uniref:NAD(P)-binding protein n=1 Tax=Gonapodya prolifera (strain JEL478) TaxID=1344416 RepID=A0A139ABQ8_GONPJ|nr:hypothetical protein M427DRAFT_33352 [Gonapodya prolifera JEL478]|eukprot:KXS14158.1 hypothetical protein M427DRAFT_33352 [Gonapodya prolifera JEL478]
MDKILDSFPFLSAFKRRPPEPSFHVVRRPPPNIPPPPTYTGPPINLVLFGCGGRAMMVLPVLLGLARGSIRRVVVADVNKHAVEMAASEMRAHLCVADLEGSATFHEVVLRDGEGGDVDRAEALRIPDDVEESDTVSEGATESKPAKVWNKWCVVSSINSLHRRDCLAAVRAAYNIFCEKPLATTLQDCKDIYEAVLSSQISAQRSSEAPPPIPRFITGFVLRHAPLYQRVHNLIHAQKLTGKIISCDFNEILGREHGSFIFRNWRRVLSLSGPNILEKSCHDLDVMSWLLGGDVPTKVAAFGGLDIFKPENAAVAEKIAEEAKASGAGSRTFRHWPSYPYVESPFTSGGEIEDNLVVILEYRSGIRATFHLNSFSAIKQRRLFICGLEGSICADLTTGAIEARRIVGGGDVAGGPGQEGGEDTHGGGDIYMVAQWWEEMCRVGKEWEEILTAGVAAGGGGGGAPVRDPDPKTTSTSTATTPTPAPRSAHSATIKDMYVAAATALAIETARREGRIVDVEEEVWKGLGL